MRKPVEQRERWIEKDGSPSIELCLRRQPARGRGDGHAGRIRRARFPVAHSEAQANGTNRRRYGRHQSAARRGGVGGQPSPGATQGDTQPGGTGSGRTDGRGSAAECCADPRRLTSFPADGTLSAWRCSPGLAAEARRRAAGAWHSQRGGSGSSTGRAPNPGADL